MGNQDIPVFSYGGIVFMDGDRVAVNFKQAIQGTKHLWAWGTLQFRDGKAWLALCYGLEGSLELDPANVAWINRNE